MLNNIFIFLLTIFSVFITIGIVLLQIDRDKARKEIRCRWDQENEA
mgnify:CR=1 FL=1